MTFLQKWNRMTNVISLSGDETQELYMNDGNQSLILVEGGDWEQDGKCQYASFIYKDKDTQNHYRLTLSRQGSYHTDWVYSYEYSDTTLQPVKEIEVVKKQWVPL